MLERPDAADLLETARALLLERLLPALPPELHYEARMIANAMGIAARAGTANPRAAQAALAALLPDAPDALAALAAAIRAGRYAPGSEGHAAARAALEALTRLRCAVSAPRALR
jgi:hypothetical protein